MPAQSAAAATAGIHTNANVVVTNRAAVRKVSGSHTVERHFDNLSVGELNFTNVWVHRQTNFNVLIRHAGGIYTIKLTDLPKEDLDALRPQIGDLANIEEDKEHVLVSRFKEMQASDALRGKVEEQLGIAEQMLKKLLLPFLAVLLVLHLLSSFFIYSICRKTKINSGIEVWFPIVNQTALLRAAGLPGVWALLGFMAPLIPPVVFTYQLLPPESMAGLFVVGVSALFALASGIVWIVWCFKICIAREKSGWLGILLLIPGVNLLTFTYLAFAE